jgi:hypothetical protein
MPRRRRRPQAFPYLSPKEFETAYAAGSLAAAPGGGKRGRKRKAGAAEVRVPFLTARPFGVKARVSIGLTPISPGRPASKPYPLPLARPIRTRSPLLLCTTHVGQAAYVGVISNRRSRLPATHPLPPTHHPAPHTHTGSAVALSMTARSAPAPRL